MQHCFCLLTCSDITVYRAVHTNTGVALVRAVTIFNTAVRTDLTRTRAVLRTFATPYRCCMYVACAVVVSRPTMPCYLCHFLTYCVTHADAHGVPQVMQHSISMVTLVRYYRWPLPLPSHYHSSDYYYNYHHNCITVLRFWRICSVTAIPSLNVNCCSAVCLDYSGCLASRGCSCSRDLL